MKTILVTGGCGFIGSHFLRLASQRGYRVLNLDKLSYCSQKPNPAFPFYQLDIGHEIEVARILETEAVDFVVNFAAESSVDRSNNLPLEFINNNVVATTRFLSACSSYGRLTKFVHVSTDEVYGHLGAHDPSVTEASPYKPRNPYAASKAASDFVALSYFHTFGLPVVITHCTNNYGVGQHPEKLIPKTIARILAGEPIPIYGDGSNVRDWIFVRDHCEAVLAVMERGSVGETFNIAGGNEKTNGEVVATLCDELAPVVGYDPHGLIQFVADRPGHDFRYSVNAGKIAAQLGFVPQTSWRDGLKETLTGTLGGRL